MEMLFWLVPLAAAAVAIVAAMYAGLVAERVERDSRIARLNADELALVQNRLDMLQTGLKRIEGRQVKAAQRAAPDPDGMPDPKNDPEAWKRWQNRLIATTKAKLQ